MEFRRVLFRSLRKEMQVELKHLQRRLGITFVFVTHDQEEALTMSDRLAVMNHGKVEQMGAAAEVFERPATRFVAEFMGAGNFFSARVSRVDGSILTAASPAGFEAALLCNGRALRVGDPIRFVVRPEKLELRAAEPAPAEGRACMEVTIEQRVYQGVATVWTVRNRAGEVMTVYQQDDGVGGDGRAFVEMGKAWACWDPRHAVILEEPV